MCFPGGSDYKEFSCNAGDLGLPPGLGRSPRGGHSKPLQYPCLKNPHGQKSLAGDSPWGYKESDRIEWLSTLSLFHTPETNTTLLILQRKKKKKKKILKKKQTHRRSLYFHLLQKCQLNYRYQNKSTNQKHAEICQG